MDKLSYPVTIASKAQVQTSADKCRQVMSASCL